MYAQVNFTKLKANIKRQSKIKSTADFKMLSPQHFFP